MRDDEFAHTPATSGFDALHSNPGLQTIPAAASQASPSPTTLFNGSSAATAFTTPNAKKKNADKRRAHVWAPFEASD